MNGSDLQQEILNSKCNHGFATETKQTRAGYNGRKIYQNVILSNLKFVRFQLPLSRVWHEQEH